MLRLSGSHAAVVAGMLLCAGNGMADERPLDSLPLEELLQIRVQTASFHTQPIETAPGTVSVVTAEEIRKYGYRTFAEVLNHVRGIYLTYDRTYRQVGVAGFAVPGDWSTRILVLVNGHAMMDNVFGSASFDEDFPVDMSLVDRIEVLRGPSSALYGSNGILATINVITVKPGAASGTQVRAETGTLGERRLTATQSLMLPRDTSLLVSGTVFNDVGQRDIYFHQYDSLADNFGHAIHMDGVRGYRFFAGLDAGNWQVFCLAGSRDKTQPISWADTVFNDRGTRAIDRRALVEALYTRESGEERVLRWRISYDAYRYKGIYHYALDGDGIDVNLERDAGDWLGTQLSYRFPWMKGDVTVGSEGRFDLRAIQNVADISPVFQQNLLVKKRDVYAAGFLQQEWRLGRHWSFNFGTRYDWSWYRRSSISPRAAMVYQPDRKTALKLVYGRGFRNPNANELFFNDGKQGAANVNLQPERADNLEFAVERTIVRSWRLNLSAYRLRDRNIIVPQYTDAGATQFVNADEFHGSGLGAEIVGKVLSSVEVAASFQKQRASFVNHGLLANSPGNVGKLRFSTPLARSRLHLSAALLYQSERRSLAGERLAPVYLPELTISSGRLWRSLDLQVGVRNLTNCYYHDPAGLTPTVDTIPQPRRSFFVSIGFRSDGR